MAAFVHRKASERRVSRGYLSTPPGSGCDAGASIQPWMTGCSKCLGPQFSLEVTGRPAISALPTEGHRAYAAL